MNDRMRRSRGTLLAAALMVLGYLVMRQIAYASRAAEVILSPGAHSGAMPVYILLICVFMRLLSTVVLPGLLAARLWWIWSGPGGTAD